MQNTWGFHGDVINLPLWTKQPNCLLSSCRSEYIFSIGSREDGRPFWCRRKQKQEWHWASPPPDIHAHFLACLVTMLRGGVTGRLPLGFFFSAGFKICKTTLGRMRSAWSLRAGDMAGATSSKVHGQSSYPRGRSPEKSTWASRPRSSWLQRCQTPHNS